MVRSTRIGVPFGSLSWLQRQPELGVLVLRRWRGKAELEVGDNSKVSCIGAGKGEKGSILRLSSGRKPL